MAALSPGMRVTDSIELVRELGGGGMGRVWVAHHATLRAEVVVKFLAPGLADDADAAARLSNEAAAIARVRSPHIVQVLDHGNLADGSPFIVMELLEGEDLGARLRREKKLPLAETARIVTQVARALSRAHERGIVHRDIKPANIFLCDVGSGEPFVKVLDFGIAKGASLAGDVDTVSGAIIGTPTYMSPEQLVGARSLDHRADLWALAAVAFRALGGVPPYAGDSIGALAIEIVNSPTPSVRALDPAIPAAVDEWFARALARDPAARFQSATEMADAFVAATGGPVDTTAPTPAPAPRSDPDAPTTLDGALALGARTPIADTASAAQTRKGARTLLVVVGVTIVAIGAVALGQRRDSTSPALPAAVASSVPSVSATPAVSTDVPPATTVTREIPTERGPDAASTTPSTTRAQPDRPRARPAASRTRERDIE